MKLIYLFPFLLLGVPLTTRAQADFRPGYIIPLAGDTVRGTLAYGIQQSALECRFKPDPAASVSKYLPEQLKGYGFLNDQFFQSQRIPVAATATDTTSQRLFLEVLVQGAATLSYLSGTSLGERYFLRSGQGPVRQLVLQTDIVVENGSKFKRGKALYRGVLAEAFQACPAVQSKVGTVAFKAKSFIEIVREYNTCVGGSQRVSAVAAANRRSFLLLGAVVGGQVSSLSFSGETSPRDQAISGGLTPVIGIAVQQYVPVLANRFGLRAEVLYQRQRYQQELSTPSAPAYSAYQEVRAAFDQLRVPVMLRYAPLNGRFQPFVALGGSIAFALTNTNESRYRALPTSAYSGWSTLLPNPRSIEQGLLAAVGGMLELPGKRHVGAELRAERSNGFSEAVGIGTAITRFSLLLSIDLTKPR